MSPNPGLPHFQTFTVCLSVAIRGCRRPLPLNTMESDLVDCGESHLPVENSMVHRGALRKSLVYRGTFQRYSWSILLSSIRENMSVRGSVPVVRDHPWTKTNT